MKIKLIIIAALLLASQIFSMEEQRSNSFFSTLESLFAEPTKNTVLAPEFSLTYQGPLSPHQDFNAALLSLALADDNAEEFSHHANNIDIFILKEFKNSEHLNVFEVAVKYDKKNIIKYFLQNTHFLAFHNRKLSDFCQSFIDWEKYIASNPFILDMRDRLGSNLLHWSIFYKIDKLTDFLLDRYPSLIRVHDNRGRSALHIAVRANSPEAIQKILVRTGALLFKTDLELGTTALHYALMLHALGHDNLHVINALYKELNTKMSDKYGESAKSVANWAISMHHKNYAEKYKQMGFNSLHIAIWERDVPGALRLLRYFPSLALAKSNNISQAQAQQTPLEMANWSIFKEQFNDFINEANQATATYLSAQLPKPSVSTTTFIADQQNRSLPNGPTTKVVRSDRVNPAYVAGKFKNPDVRLPRAPYGPSSANYADKNYIVLPFVKPRVNSFIGSISGVVIDTPVVSGIYFTATTLPEAHERVTIVLAGRRHEASFPRETGDGRVILILAGPEESKIAQTLVDENVDVFLLNSLKFSKALLKPDELTSFTSRRIAAIELGLHLPERKTIAMLDDNIQLIQISGNLLGAEQFSNWPNFYNYFAKQNEQFSCIGFKEFRQTDVNTKNAVQLTIFDQGQSGRINGLGQKMFFINLDSVFDTYDGKVENLFPPLIRLPQEDIFFQIYLAQAKTTVGHVDRHAITFKRTKQKSISKKTAQDYLTWLRVTSLPGDNGIRKSTIEAVKVYIKEDLENTKTKRNHLEIKPITGYFNKKRRVLPDGAALTDDLADFANAVKAELDFVPAKSTYQPPVTPKQAINYQYRFAEIDGPRLFDQYADELREIKGKKLWQQQLDKLGYLNSAQLDSLLSLRPYQRAALRRLSRHIKNGSHKGYFQMATGTGKTEIFFQVVHLASHSLKGNVAIILPNLNIEDQTQDRLDDFVAKLKNSINQGEAVSELNQLDKIIPISSRPENASAQFASINKSLTEGGHAVVFCEKSFPKFVEYRKGDLSDFSILIFDEMHKLQKITKKYIKGLNEKNAGLILGFSATPSGARNAFGGKANLIFRYSRERGVKKNWLAPWQTKIVQVSDDYNGFANDFINLLYELDHPNGGKLYSKQGVIYTRFRIAEIEEIAAIFRQNGIAAEAFHSQSKEPHKIIERFNQGQIQILIAIGTLREGFNSPGISFVMIQQAHPSKNDVKQIIGRAIRPDFGGKIALVLVTNEATYQLALPPQMAPATGSATRMVTQGS